MSLTALLAKIRYKDLTLGFSTLRQNVHVWIHPSIKLNRFLMVSFLILLRPLRMYILRQFLFSISVKSGHYSPPFISISKNTELLSISHLYKNNSSCLVDPKSYVQWWWLWLCHWSYLWRSSLMEQVSWNTRMVRSITGQIHLAVL